MSVLLNPHRFASGGGPTSYGWSPRDIANTRIIGVRADGDVVLSGGNVSEWRDEVDPAKKLVKSGTGNITVVAAAVGGLPCLRWPSSHTIVMTGPSLSALNGGTGGTLFAILKKRVHPSASDGMSGIWHTGAFGASPHYTWVGDGAAYMNFGNDRVGFASINTSAWHRFRALNGNNVGGLGQRFFQNNVQKFTNSTIANTFPNPFYLGYSPQSGNRYFDGDFLEVWIWDGQLSAGDTALLEQYGADRISGAWLAAGGDGP